MWRTRRAGNALRARRHDLSTDSTAPERSERHVVAFLRNVVVSLGTHVGSTLAVLAVTPVFLSKLGLETYGLWALLSSVVRYGFLADFGLGPTITKYVAEYIARDDRRRVRELATFGALFPLVVGGICTAICWFAAPTLLAIFRIPSDLRSVAPSYFTALVAYLFLYMASSVFAALLKGYGRLDVSATGAAIGQVVFAGVGAFFVLRGAGLPGLLYATFLQVGVASAFNYGYLRRTTGPVFCSPFALHSVDIRALFRMSGWIQLSVLFGFASMEIDIAVVGAFVGVAAVAILDIGGKLARALLAIAWHFNNALLPALSAREASAGADATRRTAQAGSRYLGLVSLLATGFLIASAPYVLRFWIGHAIADIRPVVAVIATFSLAFVVTNVIGVATTSLRAIGKPRLEATYGGVGAIAKLLFVLSLAPRFGLYGVLVGTVASTIAGATYFAVAFRRHSASWSESVAVWFPKAAATSVAAALAVAIVVAQLPPSFSATRVAAFGTVVLLGSLYTLVAAVLLYVSRFFDEGDVRALRRSLPQRALLARFLAPKAPV